jgi:preprotein translocase subunit SecA
VLKQTTTFLQRTEESFLSQLKERYELLEIFTDNIEQYESSPAREIQTEMQKLLGLKVQLEAGVIETLMDEPAAAVEAIKTEIKEKLVSIFLSRLKFTIERRLGYRMAVDIDTLAGADWTVIEDKVLQSVDQVFQERISILTREGNQIDHNIQSVLKKQLDSEDGRFDLVEIAANMGAGTQIVINNRTHKRMKRKVNLLNYIYFASAELEGKSPEEISADALNHLERVQKSLREIWGRIELNRLSKSFENLSGLPENYLSNIAEYLEGTTLSDLKGLSITDILTSGQDEVFQVFGKNVQTRIYRHILLQEISNLWMEHLTKMEALRVSIRMEAYAQRDPLVEYKSVSTDTFRDLFSAIRMGVISKMFRMQPARQQQSAQETHGEGNGDNQTAIPKAKKKRKRHKKRK